MHSWRQRLEDRKRGQQMQRHFRLENGNIELWHIYEVGGVWAEKVKQDKMSNLWVSKVLALVLLKVCWVVLGGSWKESRQDLKISLAGFWKRVFKTRQHHRAFVVDKYWKMLMPPARCYLPQHSKLLSQCHSQEDHVIPISTGKTEGGNSDSVKMLICKPNSRI